MANKTIFDIVTATDIAAYWEATSKERAPYVGEVLFPNKKKLGLDLEWINGNSGIPVVLNLSAFAYTHKSVACTSLSVTCCAE